MRVYCGRSAAHGADCLGQTEMGHKFNHWSGVSSNSKYRGVHQLSSNHTDEANLSLKVLTLDLHK